MIRVHGDIRRINLPAMEHKDVHGMIYDIMNDGKGNTTRRISSAISPSRYPASRAFASTPSCRTRAAAVMRTIPSKILSLEELRTPKIFAEIVDQPRGIVLVTGPTGSGKSTTLAAMVNQLNENEQGHILTSRTRSNSCTIEEMPDQSARGRTAHAVVRQCFAQRPA